MCETDRSKLHEYLGNLNEYLTELKKIDGLKSEDIEKLIAQPKYAREEVSNVISTTEQDNASILKEMNKADTDPDRPQQEP